MRSSKATLVLCAATLVSLSACGTAKRFGKDAFIVVGCPVIIPYAAANDAVESSMSIGKGLGGGAAVEVITLPFTFFYHTIEHSLYTVVHALDGCCFPLYGCAEISPFGPEIKPLDFYNGTWFDKEPASTDAMSGAPTGG
ncbi:MAG: hypothetical protein WAT39_22070 [Planctomycetota bacterium]